MEQKLATDIRHISRFNAPYEKSYIRKSVEKRMKFSLNVRGKKKGAKCSPCINYSSYVFSHFTFPRTQLSILNLFHTMHCPETQGASFKPVQTFLKVAISITFPYSNRIGHGHNLSPLFFFLYLLLAKSYPNKGKFSATSIDVGDECWGCYQHLPSYRNPVQKP